MRAIRARAFAALPEQAGVVSSWILPDTGWCCSSVVVIRLDGRTDMLCCVHHLRAPIYSSPFPSPSRISLSYLASSCIVLRDTIYLYPFTCHLSLVVSGPSTSSMRLRILVPPSYPRRPSHFAVLVSVFLISFVLSHLSSLSLLRLCWKTLVLYTTTRMTARGAYVEACGAYVHVVVRLHAYGNLLVCTLSNASAVF